MELPWALGPPDGRYLLRSPDLSADSSTSSPTHVLVLATLGAPERRRLTARKKLQAEPQPEPTPVTTGRATIIDVSSPLEGLEEAREWLSGADEEELVADLAVLNQVLHAFRLVTADPHLGPVGRHQALVARVGYGEGEQVADGQWSDARELHERQRWQRRAKVLQPQARLAAVLTGRERPLACEELTLRARLDLDQGRDREAALQLLVALDAAVAELASDQTADALRERLDELRTWRDPVADAAQASLAGELSEAQRQTVDTVVGRIEAALRARAVANA